jgi:hypothetical protein
LFGHIFAEDWDLVYVRVGWWNKGAGFEAFDDVLHVSHHPDEIIAL